MPGRVVREQAWVNVSPARKCWRLVYNTKTRRVFILFEKEGLTKTFQAMFCSDPTDDGPGSVTSREGREQCLGRAKALGLEFRIAHNPAA
jgi:hypothetical protein